jgi:hypothetical protein
MHGIDIIVQWGRDHFGNIKLSCILINYICSLNTLSASCSCDASIGGCQQSGLQGTQHPPIKRHALPQ